MEESWPYLVTNINYETVGKNWHMRNVGRHESKRPLGTPRRRLENDIKTSLKEIVCDCGLLADRPWRPDRLRGPPSLLSNGHRGPFPRWCSCRGVNLTTHLHLLSRSRMAELYFHSSIRLNGVVFYLLSTGTTLLLLYTFTFNVLPKLNDNNEMLFQLNCTFLI
jgi:hypothetical protein